MIPFPEPKDEGRNGATLIPKTVEIEQLGLLIL